MKFWRISFALVVLLSIIATYSYAHPGRTDGSGGHINHSTGEYHYHHGYSEHQHYDTDGDGVADCPFGFKTNTAKVNKDKDSSSNKNSASFTDEYNALRKQQPESKVKDSGTPKNTEQKTKRTAKEVIGAILAVIIVFPPVLVVPIAYICGKVRDLIQKMKKK